MQAYMFILKKIFFFIFPFNIVGFNKNWFAFKELDFCQEMILLTKKMLETNGNQSLPIVSNFAWANSAIGVFILPSALQLNSIPNVGKKNYANTNGFNSNM